MSAGIRWYCYYHFVWATKNRERIIQANMEKLIFDDVRFKTQELHPKNKIFAVNTMPDHIHVAIALHPTIPIMQWVKNIKGSSSHLINTTFTTLETRFRWQRGYSVHTFGAKNLSLVVEYIANQKQHHAENTIEKYLEEIEL